METLGKGGGKFKKLKHRVSWPEASVSSHGPALPSRDVLFSLAKLVGQAQEGDDAASLTFTDVDRKPGDPNASRATSSEGGGSFVEYNETRIVEADFRYTCPRAGVVTVGHAKSWISEGSGSLECGRRLDGSKEAHDLTAAREAARLSCGPKSVAAQTSGAAGQ
ncbi:hypothetical protein ACWDGI_23630 [Streptomyces sp. NPDC001220]